MGKLHPAIDELAPPVTNRNLDATTKRHGLMRKLSGDAGEFLNGAGGFSTPTGSVPGAHATTHQNGGSDEINVGGLSGVLADPQTPIAQALLDGTRHNDTTAGAVARGDVITGQGASPKWTRLAKGTASQVLSMDGTATDVVWATVAAGGNTFLDNVFRVQDNGDPTKQLAFEVSGVTTATTRTLTIPNRSSTIATLDGTQTFTGELHFPNDSVVQPPTFHSTDFGSGSIWARIYDDGSGNSMTLSVLGTPAMVNLEFPAAGGTVVTTAATQTLQNKTMETSSIFNVTSAGTGAHFRDTGTSTKRLYVTTSGAAGSNNLIVANTAARNYSLGNDTGFLDIIVAPTSATVDKIGQTASIGATNSYTTIHDGSYRISAYWVFTAVTLAGTLAVSVIYTDPQQAQTVIFMPASAFSAAGSHSVPPSSFDFYATAGSQIQFSTTLVNTGTYNLYCRVESLT